jgi:hypothetical protein
MQEVLRYLRANGYRTYIVIGDAQDFVREHAEQTCGIPPEQVVGTVAATTRIAGLSSPRSPSFCSTTIAPANWKGSI